MTLRVGDHLRGEYKIHRLHTSMGFEVLDGDGVESGVGVHRDYDGDGGHKAVFVRELP